MESLRRPLRHFLDFLLEGMWAEGLRLFFTYWRNWLLGLLVFSAVEIGIVYIKKFIPNLYIGASLELLANSAVLYFFCVCFLNQEPIKKNTPPAWRAFARSLVYFLAVIFGIFLVDITVSFLLGVIQGFSVTGFWAMSLPLLNKGIGVVLWMIGLARFCLVMPLSVSEFPAPVRESLNLTKGKALRMLFNFSVLLLIAAPFLFLSALYVPFIHAVIRIGFLGICAAFACAAARILYGEHIAATLGADRRAAPRVS